MSIHELSENNQKTGFDLRAEYQQKTPSSTCLNPFGGIVMQTMFFVFSHSFRTLMIQYLKAGT